MTSSSSSGGSDGGGDKCTEEEEEMAICLLMLARSDGPKRSDEFYFYDCKTCNRSFPSFEALGGHKASHKKPKSALRSTKKPLVLAVDDAGIALRVSNKKGNKIHECSIRGSKFASGQSLGGHVRRHRAAAASNRSAMDVA
ncbi:Copper/zinc superoxide dismutase 2 isoform 1 [Hibiscus syriacus]|uniref:Copper/zinc superoxide dismutase 2 isoform 1 n=1 Tax=Hibiscus syriacus TaxID=106335 RepID=A0A6A3D1G5_HIBSY|nr:Copper/zinc superoxide dismutase 2 isoform 1 [Hibiscus syriacus]